FRGRGGRDQLEWWFRFVGRSYLTRGVRSTWRTGKQHSARASDEYSHGQRQGGHQFEFAHEHGLDYSLGKSGGAARKLRGDLASGKVQGHLRGRGNKAGRERGGEGIRSKHRRQRGGRQNDSVADEAKAEA